MHLRLAEPLGIDPCLDIVIHKLFGDPKNEPVLINFLNAVLNWPIPIVKATVKNPFAPDLYQGQRGVVLDIRAEDELGRIYQIEMQRRNDTSLPQRMLWIWSRVYGTELGKSKDHAQLKPVIAVWICETDLFPSSKQSHLRFQMREEHEGFLLHGDAQIDVLQLRRWRSARKDILASSVGAWFWFFNEAKNWTEVPAEIDSPTMEQAMEILHDFRKDTFLNDLYRGREEAQRIERGAQKALEKSEREKEAAMAREVAEREAKEAALLAKDAALLAQDAEREAKEVALVAKEAERTAKEAALAEAERLRSLLLAAGIRLPT